MKRNDHPIIMDDKLLVQKYCRPLKQSSKTCALKPMKTANHSSPPLLEQSKVIEIRGSQAQVVRLWWHPCAFADRESAQKALIRREKELALIKKDCQRLRGLLRDLD